MPRTQPRSSNGQFISGDISLPLPSFIGLYKILIIGFLIFPWYAIISNRNLSNVLFNYILGTNYTNPNCPKCEKCEVCPICEECEICPKCEVCPICEK